MPGELKLLPYSLENKLNSRMYKTKYIIVMVPNYHHDTININISCHYQYYLLISCLDLTNPSTSYKGILNWLTNVFVMISPSWYLVYIFQHDYPFIYLLLTP